MGTNFHTKSMGIGVLLYCGDLIEKQGVKW